MPSAPDRLRGRCRGILPRSLAQGVRRHGARLDRAHLPEHFRRQRLGLEYRCQRLVYAAFHGAVPFHAGPGLSARHGLSDDQGGMHVLGAPAEAARGWQAGLAGRLVARTRAARGWRDVRPADHLGPVPELPGSRGHSRSRSRLPRHRAGVAGPARAEPDRPLESAAGVAGRYRQSRRQAPAHLAPVRGLSGPPDHAGHEPGVRGGGDGIAAGAVRRLGGHPVHAGIRHGR
ncbi:hypothetical protein D3C86_1482240 [compost metagenome]